MTPAVVNLGHVNGIINLESYRSSMDSNLQDRLGGGRGVIVLANGLAISEPF